MSYSFSVRGATKQAILSAVAEEMAKVVASQPVHAADQQAVMANATAVVGLMADDESRDISISCNGSIWTGVGGVQKVGISASANFIDKS